MRRAIALVVVCVALAGCRSGGCDSGEPEGKAVDLASKTESSVARGTEMFADMEVHGSVGLEAELKISDSSVLRMVGSELTYTNPEKMKPGMTGGDQGVRRYRFRAIEPGTAQLELITMYRGQVKKARTVRITVR
jgi:predicted secreted protein